MNRLASDGVWSYEYDHNGNMKKKTSAADAHVFWKYYYDYKNRMTGAERFEPDAAGTNAERTRAVRYIYDPLGRRIMKGVKDGVQDIALNRWTLMRKYIYDGDDIVQEYTWNDDVNIDRLTSRWTHGPGVDEPLVWWYDPDQMDSDTALKPFFYHFDGLGSVTAITDSAGEIVAKYIYDAFGDTVQQCGPLAARNFYQYTSREYDPETDLHYYRARTYDRRLGGFYQEDPKWDPNLYWYVNDNPVMKVDSFGQDAYELSLSAGTAFIFGKGLLYGWAWDDKDGFCDIASVLTTKGIQADASVNVNFSILFGQNRKATDFLNNDIYAMGAGASSQLAKGLLTMANITGKAAKLISFFGYSVHALKLGNKIIGLNISISVGKGISFVNKITSSNYKGAITSFIESFFKWYDVQIPQPR